MAATTQPKTYIQRDWTERALLADGFLSYRPVKRVTMARKLPEKESPKSIRTNGNIIVAEAGY
ncbi:MAG TPA: hypothetical protein VHL11_20245 [Phototrophicaceae bacterium]|jgi:hypothetical protein|nr:hypothetical protein [Phototrophicaceae bacterium]